MGCGFSSSSNSSSGGDKDGGGGDDDGLNNEKEGAAVKAFNAGGARPGEGLSQYLCLP